MAELAVPAWAEFAGQATRWHPGHIVERYGEFTIIVLGEVVAATAAAVQAAAAATPVLTLPVSAVLMVVLVVLLLAYHLTAAHRAVPG